MLRYFRINDPYRLLGLLVLLLIISLPLFIDPPPVTKTELHSLLVGEKLNEDNVGYTDIVDNTAPLSALFHHVMDIVFGKSILARHVISFLIIFFHAGFIGIIFITKKVFSENTFIPSLIFSLLFFFSFDTLALSDELLGSGFLLLALNNLFKEIEFRMPRDETTFSLGLYISLASMCYLPYMIFLFGIIVMLFLFARTDIRKFFLLNFGFLLPHLMVICIAFLSGNASRLWDHYYATGISINRDILVSTKGLVILSIIPIFYLVVSIVMLNRLARFSKYQSQLLQSCFLYIGFCFIYLLFCHDLRPQSLIVLLPPITFLFTHFLLLIRRRKFAEMNIWILILGTVTIMYLGRYGKLRGVDYNNLTAGDRIERSSPKKILVLDYDVSPYLKEKQATVFVRWDQAKETFEHPEYFESVTEVYDAFLADPPDEIKDKNDLMKPFFERIPELKKKYRREEGGYVRIVSN